ncbi:MAG TPA: DNA repair protein RecO [Saprospiraceae bacterium]|nr:DNA repair protein RecO [Saprospiraceae bacterium]
MLLHTRGIVFRTVKYGETSVIADIFTEERGLHSFIAGSVRTAKSRMPLGLFQPMTVIDLVAYVRDREGSLNRLKECRASEVFSAIPFDVRRGAVALFMAEICRKSIHEAEPQPDLFDFLLDNLLWLDSTPHPIANLHLHFLLHLTGFLGFQPQQEIETDEVFFDLREGAFSPVPPPHPSYLEAGDTALLLELMATPLQEAHQVPLGRPQRKLLLQRLLQFYQLHLPGFSAVNTPDILDMVME